MDKNFDIVSTCLKKFIQNTQSFSFYIDEDERDGTILVSYFPEETLGNMDKVWDRLYDLKNYLIDILPDGIILFSNGDNLFSVSKRAIEISSMKRTGEIIISESSWDMLNNNDNRGESLYMIFNEPYCLAA